jgi:hypothetical protein
MGTLASAGVRQLMHAGCPSRARGPNASLNDGRSNLRTPQAADSVFYHVGHARGCPAYGEDDPKQYGAGLLFVNRARRYSILAGVPGPCVFESGYTTYLSAPFRLAHAQFVILQGCLTTYDSTVGDSIGHQISRAGAGTVVGFKKIISFADHYGDAPGSNRPYADAWAAGFWAAFGSGKTVGESVDAAVAYEQRLSGPNHGYNRGDIQILHHRGAPTRLAANPLVARAQRQSSAFDTSAGYTSAGWAARRESKLSRHLRTVLRRFLGRTLPPHLR